MKTTGMTRKVDELGRIVFPIEIRRQLDINVKDGMEIFLDEDRIVLQKYKPNYQCMITGEVDSRNKVLAGGKIIVSPEGALQLEEQLKSYLDQKM